MDRISEFISKVTATVQQKVKQFLQQRNASKNAPLTTVSMGYEINLVPEVKHQMIKALKVRNLVLFICIVVSAASLITVAVLFSIKSGQDIAMASQDRKLETMSAKLLGFDGLEDLVTIQSQLNGLEEIANNKRVLSRVFGALGAMLPTGGDIVQISELKVDLDASTLRMEAQADARVAPLIDYRVLESFKKGVALTTYDYGRYVDAAGNEIPTWCIDEADSDGMAYRDGENYYAWWNLNTEGCAGIPIGSSVIKDDEGEDLVGLFYSKKAETEKETVEVEVTDGDQVTTKTEVRVARVKIWRTPQFATWYSSGSMELDGEISGIEHFDSACINYSGVSEGRGAAKWSSKNDCLLAPEGLTVSASSNGRNESNDLVLRFTASLTVEPEFFKFTNKHMMAIGPMGQNVTDSYIQIGGMFAKPATECMDGDSECMRGSN